MLPNRHHRGDAYILDALRSALDKAWEAANDEAKALIKRPRDVFAEGAWEEFLVFTENYR